MGTKWIDFAALKREVRYLRSTVADESEEVLGESEAWRRRRSRRGIGGPSDTSTDVPANAIAAPIALPNNPSNTLSVRA